MSKLRAGIVLGVGLLLATAAYAAPFATVTRVSGKVLVNQGEEFVPVAEGLRLQAGDRVMAQDDGGADVKFDDECKLEVAKNTIVTIPEKSPCEGGKALVQQLNPSGSEAIGSTARADTHGAAALVGIVAAIDLWWLNEDESDSVSP